EALVVRRAAGEPLPEDAHTPEYLVEVLNLIRLQHPEALLVTADQEALLAEGEFDDAGNAKTLRAAVDELACREVELNSFTAHLLEQHKATGLSGARLEIAARLLTEQLESIDPTLSQE
ncbi:MAG: hypothetical protein ACYTGQ_08675, partial [Planctomycetota bacterium]